MIYFYRGWVGGRVESAQQLLEVKGDADLGDLKSVVWMVAGFTIPPLPSTLFPLFPSYVHFFDGLYRLQPEDYSVAFGTQTTVVQNSPYIIRCYIVSDPNSSFPDHVTCKEKASVCA